MDELDGDVAVIVATYGDDEWSALAQARAVPSARDQAPTFHFQGPTLAAARNSGLRHLAHRYDWLVFLDADDELSPGYIEAMRASDADLRVPSVSYVRNGLPRPPYIPRVAGHQHECTADCLPDGNWIVIGAMVRAQLALDVGGFREFDWSEDWDLWTRVWQRGGSVERVPDAVYVAHVRPDSRNRAPDAEFKNRVHRQIHAANFGRPS